MFKAIKIRNLKFKKIKRNKGITRKLIICLKQKGDFGGTRGKNTSIGIRKEKIFA